MKFSERFPRIECPGCRREIRHYAASPFRICPGCGHKFDPSLCRAKAAETRGCESRTSS